MASERAIMRAAIPLGGARVAIWGQRVTAPTVMFAIALGAVAIAVLNPSWFVNPEVEITLRWPIIVVAGRTAKIHRRRRWAILRPPKEIGLLAILVSW